MKIWDIYSPAEPLLASLTGHTHQIQAIDLLQIDSSAGKSCYVVSGSWDKTIRVWDITNLVCKKTNSNKPKIHNNRCVHVLRDGHKNRVKCIRSLTRDQNSNSNNSQSARCQIQSLFISAGDDSLIIVWDAILGSLIYVFNGANQYGVSCLSNISCNELLPSTSSTDSADSDSEKSQKYLISFASSSSSRSAIRVWSAHLQVPCGSSSTASYLTKTINGEFDFDDSDDDFDELFEKKVR